MRVDCNLDRVHTKNPFKIHKLFTSLCNMVQESNTKLHNTSAHPVKGRNLTIADGRHTLSVKTDRKCVLCDFTVIYFFFNNVRSWEMQFLTDKLTVFP